MTLNRSDQIRSSAIWAAYGDALGFMTELADAKRVKYRTGVSVVESTRPWKRKVGGKVGVSVQMPAGAYSDDTQLRLATARAIRADGSFDVAAFSKVELTAWANYCLGAGAGTREAAANLARSSATWYSNFFETKRGSYMLGGGNGAAMRVQPHVWAAANAEIGPVLREVFKNAICTHGHPRGIVGACFHATILHSALKGGKPPALAEIESIAEDLRVLHTLVMEDADIRLFWLGPWEDKLGCDSRTAIQGVIGELREDIAILQGLPKASPAATYLRAVEELGGLEARTRGSGTKTALLASFLAELYRDESVAGAMTTAANCLGSDTDSIATMAGAILGATSTERCEGPIQDVEYINESASKLAEIAVGESKFSFGYPDLRSWRPARTAVDAIATSEVGLILRGIGLADPLDSPPMREGNQIALRWLRLEFGQTILGRIREAPMFISEPSTDVVPQRQIRPRGSNGSDVGQSQRSPDLFSSGSTSDHRLPPHSKVARPLSVNSALQRVIDSGFDPTVAGTVLLEQAASGEDEFLERGVALAATILKAYEARMRKRA